MASNQSHSKVTTYHRLNNSNWTNSSKKTWIKAIYDHHNHPWHHLFSMSKRKLGIFDHVKIIATSMIGQLKMLTLYLSFLRSWINSKAQNILLNWMSDGVITISGSEKVTNGKPHSKPIKDYSNPL